MGNRADKLVDAYYRYSRDIGENLERFDISDRVSHLVKYNKKMYEMEIENMKKKGYYKE